MHTQYWVEYQITGFSGVYKAGPYGDEYQAEAQLRDIQEYEGVHACRVVPENVENAVELTF